MKPKLEAITPKPSANPELHQCLRDCVSLCMNHRSKPVGYAFVSFHEDGSFHAYYQAPPGASGVDVPEMVKTRLMVRLLKDGI